MRNITELFHNAKAKRIPSFLLETWQKNEQKNKRYITKNNYDPVADYEYEINLSDVSLSIFLFFTAIMFLIMGFSVYDKSNLWYLQGGVFCFVVSILCAVLGVISYRKILRLEGLWNGNNCFETIGKLFFLLEIRPTVAIGKMSQEEFRANVEDFLKQLAVSVDLATGFEKVEVRERFNRAHSLLLQFDLCHVDHSKYYPSKKT